MTAFHLDAQLRVVACENPKCPLEQRAHFSSRSEALGSISLTRELEALAAPQRQLNFQRAFSAKTKRDYLEAYVRTPLNEEAIFTVEQDGSCFRGTMLYTGQEIVLATAVGDEQELLEETARITAYEADRLYGFDLWPHSEVVALYDSLRLYSTAKCISAPKIFYLDRLDSPMGQQHYSGETVTGTRLQLRAAHGYAVALVEGETEDKIVHESALALAVFRSSAERDAFAAKAFGPLFALGEI